MEAVVTSKQRKRETVPVSLSGGRGFGFEDQVATWLLVHMLKGGTPLGSTHGSVTRVHWQTQDMNLRKLDDLAVELRTPNGKASAFIPVKSDQQVTSNGFPDWFVRAAWQLSRANGSESFATERDLLVLVVGDISAAVRDAWKNLLPQLLEADANRIANRLVDKGQTSEAMRSLFDSFRCPEDLREGAQTDVIARTTLMRSVRLLPLDFLHTPSQDHDSILSVARDVVTDGTLQSAQQLWNVLCAFAETQRVAGGSADLRKVLSTPGLPNLREHPDYRPSWTILRRNAESAIAGVRSDIAGQLSLPRRRLFDDVKKLVSRNGLAALVGQSGSGKSVISKHIATESLRHGHVLWISDSIARRAAETSIESALSISVDLKDLLNDVASSSALLVVDGVDRFDDAALLLLSNFVNTAVKHPRWQVVITLTPDGWRRMSAALARTGCVVPSESVFPVSELTSNELVVALTAFPRIRHLALRPELHPLLRNLKVIDWIADESVQSLIAEHSGPVGLPAVSEWVWSRWMTNGPTRHARAQVLKNLAEIEGEHLSAGAAISTVQDPATLAALEDDQIVTIEHGRVRFEHDLIGDWARMQILIERRTEGVAALLQLVSQPRWQHAIRLFSQWCLERPSGASEWTSLLDALSIDQDGATLAADLLFDGLVTSASASALLERAWPQLLHKDGARLRRLLRRFLHVATFPDPRIDAVAEDEREREVLRATVRVPFWPLWLPVLPILEQHADDVIRIAPDIAAALCRSWLATTASQDGNKSSFPCRDTAARLAIRIAQEFQGRLVEGIHYRDREDEVAWEALFLAVEELPDEASSILLELAGRRSASSQIVARKKAFEQKQKKAFEERQAQLSEEQRQQQRQMRRQLRPHRFPRGPEIGPWPDGPARRIHESFRRIALSPHSIIPLLRHRPNIASEVLLAACIDAPHEGNPFGGSDLIDHLEMWDWGHATPPMYFRGPFLKALQTAPDAALNIIVRLVNFVTERWEEWDQQWERERAELEQPTAPATRHVELLINGAVQTWLGDCRVYGWYRDRLADAPIVVAALMALEKWLYDQVEEQQDVSPQVQYIWKSGRSAAFLGVFSAVARRHRHLLVGCLQPLMSVWQVYGWDQRIFLDTDSRATSGLIMMRWSRLGEQVFNDVFKWHSMPHRKFDLSRCAMRTFAIVPAVREWFETVRQSWQQQISQLHGDDLRTVEVLIAQFDPGNYVVREDGDESIIAFEPPSELKSKLEAEWKASDRSQRTILFPVQCQQILSGATTLKRSRLPSIWEEMQELAKVSEGNVERRASIVCGGIAVIVACDLDWLRDQQEKWEWANRELSAILEFPPRSDIPVRGSAGDFMWDCFFAEIAMVLFAADPGDPTVREWAATSVMAFHYNATKCAVAAAWKRRRELENDIEQLLSLACYWGGLSRIIEHALHHEQRRDAYGEWCVRLVQAFVDGNLKTGVPLTRIAAFARRVIERQRLRRFPKARRGGSRMEDSDSSRARRSRAEVGVDPGVLQTVLEAILPIERLEQSSRRMQLALISEALDVTLQTLAAQTSDDEALEIDGTPWAFDRSIFALVASVIPQMTDTELPQALWEPILRLGPAAHYWVEGFLTDWLHSGYKASTNRNRFFEIWRLLIEFAQQCSQWDMTSGRQGFRLGDMWTELMGMGLGGKSLADDHENAVHLVQMVALYEQWMSRWLKDGRAVVAISTFAQRPAARCLLSAVVKGLSRVAPTIDDHQWVSYGVGSRIAGVCSCCMQHCRTQLESDSELRRSFLELLQILAEHQEPQGMHLQDEVRSLQN